MALDGILGLSAGLATTVLLMDMMDDSVNHLPMMMPFIFDLLDSDTESDSNSSSEYYEGQVSIPIPPDNPPHNSSTSPIIIPSQDNDGPSLEENRTNEVIEIDCDPDTNQSNNNRILCSISLSQEPKVIEILADDDSNSANKVRDEEQNEETVDEKENIQSVENKDPVEKKKQQATEWLADESHLFNLPSTSAQANEKCLMTGHELKMASLKKQVELAKLQLEICKRKRSEKKSFDLRLELINKSIEVEELRGQSLKQQSKFLQTLIDRDGVKQNLHLPVEKEKEQRFDDEDDKDTEQFDDSEVTGSGNESADQSGFNIHTSSASSDESESENCSNTYCYEGVEYDDSTEDDKQMLGEFDSVGEWTDSKQQVFPPQIKPSSNLNSGRDVNENVTKPASFFKFKCNSDTQYNGAMEKEEVDEHNDGQFKTPEKTRKMHAQSLLDAYLEKRRVPALNWGTFNQKTSEQARLFNHNSDAQYFSAVKTEETGEVNNGQVEPPKKILKMNSQAFSKYLDEYIEKKETPDCDYDTYRQKMLKQKNDKPCSYPKLDLYDRFMHSQRHRGSTKALLIDTCKKTLQASTYLKKRRSVDSMDDEVSPPEEPLHSSLADYEPIYEPIDKIEQIDWEQSCYNSLTNVDDAIQAKMSESYDYMFRCGICDELFMTIHSLKLHHNKHDMSHQCFICGDTFVNNSQLGRHVNFKHEVPLKCFSCSKSYMYHHTFRDHVMRDHMALKHFGCGVCGKTVVTSKNLEDHMKIHYVTEW